MWWVLERLAEESPGGYQKRLKCANYTVPIFQSRLFGLGLKWGTTLTRSRDRSHSRLKSSGYATIARHAASYSVEHHAREEPERNLGVATGLQRCTTGLGHYVCGLHHYAFLYAFHMSTTNQIAVIFCVVSALMNNTMERQFGDGVSIYNGESSLEQHSSRPLCSQDMDCKAGCRSIVFSSRLAT